MPFATAATGFRNPATRTRGSSHALADEGAQEALSTSMEMILRGVAGEGHKGSTPATIEELLANPHQPRTLDPTLLAARKDGFRGGLLSVETTDFARFVLPARTPAEIEWGREWLLAHEATMRSGGPDRCDIPWDQVAHERDLRARSHSDWTVYAQEHDWKQPHRPYCQGPPAHPLSAEVQWVLLLPEAVSPVSGEPNAPGVIHPRWVEHLQALHRWALWVARERLKTAPGPWVRANYGTAADMWCTSIEWRAFQIPLPVAVLEQVWLVAQCKVRDLLGLCNYIDADHLREHALSSDNRPYTRNYVGVLYDPAYRHDNDRYYQAGVPVLRALSNPPRDECLTDRWVQEKLAKLMHAATPEDRARYQSRGDQVRRPDTRTLQQQRSAMRPSSKQRKRAKKLRARSESPEEGEVVVTLDPVAVAHTRQSVRHSLGMMGPSAAFSEGPGAEVREARWTDHPAYMPGAAALTIPMHLGNGTTTETLRARPPSQETPAVPDFLADKNFVSRIHDTFRDYALLSPEEQRLRDPPPMPHMPASQQSTHDSSSQTDPRKAETKTITLREWTARRRNGQLRDPREEEELPHKERLASTD